MNTQQENTTMETVTLNGIEYIRADSMRQAPTGNRAVVVVDRGWIFAGDVTDENGRIKLTRAVWVFKWDAVGFAVVIDDPSKADIRPIADVDIPAGSEIYRIPVADDWGL